MNDHAADARLTGAASLSIAGLGLAAFVTQLLMLREALSIFSGNELTLGILLGNWLLLTAAGTFLGRHVPRLPNFLTWALVTQVVVAFAPLLEILLFRAVKGALVPGLMVGIGEAFWISLLLLLPFCLASGFLLAALSGQLSARSTPAQVGTVYLLDTLGGLAGGLLFCFCIVHFFTPLQTATFLLALNLIAAFFLARAARKHAFALALTVLLFAALVTLRVTDLERVSANWLSATGQVVLRRFTPYGDLTVVRQAGQLDVYQNGIPVGSTHNPAAAEEIVHYALAQLERPDWVLLVGGGLVGAHREVAKYPVERIDCLEPDPAAIDLTRELGAADADPRVRSVVDDARKFLRSQRSRYDAVLLAIPDPSSAQLNRFFTVEFFATVRRALRPDGVFSFSLSGGENYAGPEVRLLSSAVYAALTTVFPHVLIVPGDRQTFVASHHPLSYDIADRLRARGIATRYVNDDYLAARLTQDRLREAQRTVTAQVSANRDFFPVSYYAHLHYWLSQFGSSLLLPITVIATLLVVLGALLVSSRRRAVPAAISASGFAGMGLEVVLLIAFQACYGYIYQHAGALILGFMAGAAAGAAWAASKVGEARKLLLRLDALLATLSFLLAPTLLFLARTESPLLQSVAAPLLFPLLTAAVGFLVGGQFPPAARLVFDGVERTTGSLFAFDLVGASLGALLVSTFLIPLLGIPATSLVVGGLKVVTAVALRAPSAVRLAQEQLPPPLEASLSLAAMLLLFLLIGAAITAEQTSSRVYALSLSPSYYWSLVALMVLGIVHAMDPQGFRKMGGALGNVLQRCGRAVRGRTRFPLLRWIYFAAFSLAVFYPIFRCYFRLPYLFCHVCPRKCIFGLLRPYLVPAALIMNLERRLWCYHGCPIGTLADAQGHVARRSRRVPHVLRVLSVAMLAFTAVAYFKVMWDLETQPAANDWYTFFYRNAFAVSVGVLLTTGLLIGLTSLLRRPFCEALCPVGAFSDLVQWGGPSLADVGSDTRRREQLRVAAKGTPSQ